MEQFQNFPLTIYMFVSRDVFSNIYTYIYLKKIQIENQDIFSQVNQSTYRSARVDNVIQTLARNSFALIKNVR